MAGCLQAIPRRLQVGGGVANFARVAVLLECLGHVRDLYYEIYVVTMQPSSVALEALNLLGGSELVRGILGRDCGLEPAKSALYAELARERKGASLLAVDDRLENLVVALRLGAVPLHASKDAYKAAQAARLGVPSAPPSEILALLASAR